MIALRYCCVLVIAVSVVAWLMGWQWMYGNACAWQMYLLYHFSHVNVWHLLANSYALYGFKPRASTLAVGYVVATLAGVVDNYAFADDIGTMGMSAMVFACMARRNIAWKESPWMAVVCMALCAFVPGINWHVHILAFFMGYGAWYLLYKAKGKSDWLTNLLKY